MIMPFTVHTYNENGKEVQVPTIQLGVGDVFMGSVTNASTGMAGVAFIVDKPGEIGREHPDHKGRTVSELGAVFQVLSDNRESLEVLLEAVQIAISDFDEMQSKNSDSENSESQHD